MARKTNPVPPQETRLEFTVSREEAEAKIQERIDKGNELLSHQINSPEQLNATRNDYYNWTEYNSALLERLYSNASVSSKYDNGFCFSCSPDSFQEEVKGFRDDISFKIRHLQSIKEQLELIPVAPNIAHPEATQLVPKALGNKAFVVHGHDEGLKEAVARFLEKLGMQAIILHEHPNKGDTLIEKLERCSEVGFAVVMLTPDDEGKAKDEATLSPRARQNVILELGYFIGKLGRDHVCALYKEVDPPSDFQGVVYVPLDARGAWRLTLARELKAAGFDVDMNAAL